MGDKRVCFDFEVDFANGGGIQGQDFRLDLDADWLQLAGSNAGQIDQANVDQANVDDDWLAEYIVRDMRLLMVGAVRILNKRIIDEPHKRCTIASVATADGDPARVDNAAATMIDLSHVIEDGMITYKGLPGPLICDHLSRDASRSVYADGTEFQIGRIEMVGNTGTYLDVPFHRYAEGDDLAALDLARVSGVAGVLVRVTGATEREIDWHHFAAVDCAGKAVLVHTGWDRHWRTDAYFEGHPFLTEAAATYLRDQEVSVVGIDSFNIDDTSGGTRPVHTVLLGGGIPIVEHMTNLGALTTEGFRFSATPPKVAGMGTFPVRAHAWFD